MPHELSFATNGEAEMFYVGNTPWHGFGQQLDNPATAEEAIRAAHLDWEVALEPVYAATNLGPPHGQVEPYRFVRRLDNGKILGMRTSRYSVVQNVNCFGLFDAVIGPGQGVYQTAGALKDGRIVWILAKMGSGREVVPGDTVEPYILLSTSHDGSMPLQMRHTMVRVVCNNTLQAAMGRSQGDIMTIRHSGNVEAKATMARRVLGLNEAYFERMMEGAEKLVATTMNDADMVAFSNTLIRPYKADSQSTHRFLREGREKLRELFTTGRGQDIPGVRGTAWAAYNAATEYVDYFQRVGRGVEIGEASSDRLHKAWFGTGRDMKVRAWDLLHDYTGNGAGVFAQSVNVDA
jgi:phage/plasmid-like protein (TIGR03299 family)